MTHGRILLEDDPLNAGRVKEEIGGDVSSYSSTIIIDHYRMLSTLELADIAFHRIVPIDDVPQSGLLVVVPHSSLFRLLLLLLAKNFLTHWQLHFIPGSLPVVKGRSPIG
jgi:hypothetical protein